MTLDAGVVRVHVVEPAGVDDRFPDWLCDMRAARPMASLAPDIPLRDGLGRDIVVHGMATVAERAGRPLSIVRRVKRSPPILAVQNEIFPPNLVGDIPLCRQWKIVIAHLLEVALFPFAPIHEGDVVLRERDERVRL